MTDLAGLPPTTSAEQDDFGLARQIRQGGWLVALLVLLVLGWGGLARVSDAVIGQGAVVTQTGPQGVEHPQGGRIDQLLVREGDVVTRGQPLARLSPAAAEAAAALSMVRTRELEARRRRLIAERDGSSLDVHEADPQMQAALLEETRTLAGRRRLEVDKRRQLQQEIVQTRAEIAGLREQIAAGAAQRELIEVELVGMRRLYADGYATVTRVNALEREAHRLDGEQGAQRAAIARGEARIVQLRVQIDQTRSETAASVLEELAETQLQLEQARAQHQTDADAREHLLLRAPISGRIQQLVIRAPGGVLGPGEPLALVVPQSDRLIVETRIAPDRIDRVRTGQAVKVRFPAFAAATTPEFPGRVLRISPTVQKDESTGADFYLVACELRAGAHPGLNRLKAGMPAEVHLQGGSRIALSYFLKPLLDQVARTFREP